MLYTHEHTNIWNTCARVHHVYTNCNIQWDVKQKQEWSVSTPKMNPSAFTLSINQVSKSNLKCIKMAASWSYICWPCGAVCTGLNAWQLGSGGRYLYVCCFVFFLHGALSPAHTVCFAAMKTEEQCVCGMVSPPLCFQPPPSPPPSRTAKQQGGRCWWQGLLGNGDAHSPSGSPHSVHCDSKQGPKRDNRRLIEATHMWKSVFFACVYGNKYQRHRPL